MKRKMAIVCLLILISGMAILLLGCPPPVVMIRPPEPRVEVYVSPPYPEAVWITGYWKYGEGEWFWIPGHWAPRGRGWVWHPGHWDYR